MSMVGELNNLQLILGSDSAIFFLNIGNRNLAYGQIHKIHFHSFPGFSIWLPCIVYSKRKTKINLQYRFQAYLYHGQIF